MNNLAKYKNAFVDAFGIDAEMVENLKYQDISEWDSVGHMRMITILEEVFDIMIDIDDMIDFSSYEKGKEILAKYNVAV